MFEGILFHLELVMYHKTQVFKERIVVTECPAPEAMQAMQLKYKRPGMFVRVTCAQLRGEKRGSIQSIPLSY